MLPVGELVNEVGQGKAPQAFDFDSIAVFRDGNVTKSSLLCLSAWFRSRSTARSRVVAEPLSTKDRVDNLPHGKG